MLNKKFTQVAGLTLATILTGGIGLSLQGCNNNDVDAQQRRDERLREMQQEKHRQELAPVLPRSVDHVLLSISRFGTGYQDSSYAMGMVDINYERSPITVADCKELVQASTGKYDKVSVTCTNRGKIVAQFDNQGRSFIPQ